MSKSGFIYRPLREWAGKLLEKDGPTASRMATAFAVGTPRYLPGYFFATEDIGLHASDDDPRVTRMLSDAECAALQANARIAALYGVRLPR